MVPSKQALTVTLRPAPSLGPVEPMHQQTTDRESGESPPKESRMPAKITEDNQQPVFARAHPNALRMLMKSNAKFSFKQLLHGG